MRMQSEQEQFIIAKFKRHGHRITRKSLQKTISWLRQKPTHSLDILLKKISHLALQNNNIDDNLQHTIEILSMKNRSLGSYEDLLDEVRKRCIYAISPYERNLDTWFTQRPDPQLFSFKPEQKLKNSQTQFKRISDINKDTGRGFMVGIIYQNYSLLTQEGKQKLMMQNQVNEVELTFPPDFKVECLLFPGCTYIAQGRQQGKDLAFKVDKITLPNLPGQDKQSLLKLKFKQMCQNISAGKDNVGYQPYDFVKYDCVYTPPLHPNRPSLVFGNVTLNNKTITRIKRLIDAYPNGVACIILMLSAQAQEQIDFTVWLKCKVYLIPHISAAGPRFLPKLPLLKNHNNGARVLTNPVKICLEGRQVVLANYPLIRSVMSQSILVSEAPQLSQEQIVAKVTDLLFSQGTIGLGFDHYWPQADYFNICSESIVVVTDGVAATAYQKRGKAGGLANTGNFDRDGDFLCVMSWAKQALQMCGQMLQ